MMYIYIQKEKMEKVRLRTSANMADRSRTSSSENDLQILRISYVNTRPI